MTKTDTIPQLRVFISYAVGPMTAPAQALKAAIERHGMSAWSVHADAPVGSNWEESIDEEIRKADSFLILISPGDEGNRWLLFEIRRILSRIWSGEDANVSVLAPAIGAIPSALRNQDLVSYFPHDEIQLDRWTREPASVDAFVERWLRGPTSSLPAEDLDRWRNALLHVGSSQVPSSEEKDRILGLLSTELERDRWIPQGASPAERLEAALSRAVVAQQLEDNALALEYFRLADDAAEKSGGENAETQYAAGLAALGAAELTRATELFSRSAERYEESYGAVDPRTIAALYNLALAQSSQGRADQAIVTYKSVLSRSLQGLGPHHPQTASVEFNLAQLLAAAGESEDAIALLEAATEAYEQVTPADSSELAAVRSELLRLRS